MMLKIFYINLLLGIGLLASAQTPSRLDSALRLLAKEKDPEKTVALMNRIVNDHRLEPGKDAETFDAMYGTIAVNFAMRRNYTAYEKYISLIDNKFNQTSFMNMAASMLLDQKVDALQAHRISEETIRLYQQLAKDSTLRPAQFSKPDWDRFIGFAQYPYYDTRANALFALKRYEEALTYQEKAFMGKPEDGIPAAVGRYARLLAHTGKKEQAKQLLLQMARLGRLNKDMTAQLQELYLGDNSSDRDLGRLLDSMQKNVRATLVKELTPNMLNETANPFTLKDIHGKKVSLADYRGKTVVLDLWATWCVPCIASFPAMKTVVQKHPEVVFLFIAVEERDKNPLPAVKKFIESRKYPFRVLLDEPVKPGAEQYKIMSAYRPNGIPTKYIIDKQGTLRFKNSGFTTDTELINELEAMLSIVSGLPAN
jgi:thiol-disulfide isomerase/thioredoxin